MEDSLFHSLFLLSSIFFFFFLILSSLRPCSPFCLIFLHVFSSFSFFLFLTNHLLLFLLHCVVVILSSNLSLFLSMFSFVFLCFLPVFSSVSLCLFTSPFLRLYLSSIFLSAFCHLQLPLLLLFVVPWFLLPSIIYILLLFIFLSSLFVPPLYFFLFHTHPVSPLSTLHASYLPSYYYTSLLFAPLPPSFPPFSSFYALILLASHLI